MSSGAVIYIITAGNCGVCTNLKNAGLLDKIGDHLKGLGCKVEPKFATTMSTELNTGSKMDAVLNQSFRRWFPIFVAFNRRLVDLVESGGSVALEDVIASASVFNGLYSKDTGRFELDRKYNQLNTEAFSSWLGAVLASKEFAYGGSLKSQGVPVVPEPIGRSLIPAVGGKGSISGGGEQVLVSPVGGGHGGSSNIMGIGSNSEYASCERFTFNLKSRYHG